MESHNLLASSISKNNIEIIQTTWQLIIVNKSFFTAFNARMRHQKKNEYLVVKFKVSHFAYIANLRL